MIRATLQLLKSCLASLLTTLAAQADDWQTLAVSDSIVANVSVSVLIVIELDVVPKFIRSMR